MVRNRSQWNSSSLLVTTTRLLMLPQIPRSIRTTVILSLIICRFYKQYLAVSIEGSVSDFGHAVGSLGDYHNGENEKPRRVYRAKQRRERF
mmetsp:Transcript_3729/g.7122  ORF Transcript_3729/g.7122 Transcript_3729/m.7122 type:complete len:91 (+) Transcript_3729:1063-1335(+)